MNECWLYAGLTDSYDYGIISAGKLYKAHRVMYENLVGEIPTGLVLDHLCRIPRCINPEHLEPVTNGANVLRGVSNSAVNKRKEFCKFGHEFTPDNTYVYPRGWRGCRKCRTRLNRVQNKRRRL